MNDILFNIIYPRFIGSMEFCLGLSVIEEKWLMKDQNEKKLSLCCLKCIVHDWDSFLNVKINL